MRAASDHNDLPEEDRLVYDSALGWIDPEHVLESLGIHHSATRNFHFYSGDLLPCTVVFPRQVENWPAYRALLEALFQHASEQPSATAQTVSVS